ncbi:MAG: hypothetical protein JWM40_1044 [Frankiales bacterium]|nr:hypothetical protein [Frankiales bacterium]
MEHVVFFPAHDGSPAFRRVASLQDAVRLVEHLRNVEGVNESSVHALSEVPLAFKPYYRVEIPAGAEEAQAAPQAPVEVQAPLTVQGAEPVTPPIVVAAPTPSVVPVLAPLAAVADAPAVVAVPEQGEAPAEAPAPVAEDEPVKESAASLGFFAS